MCGRRWRLLIALTAVAGACEGRDDAGEADFRVPPSGGRTPYDPAAITVTPLLESVCVPG